MKKSILLLTACLLSMSIFAQSWWGSGVKGEGPIVERTLNLDKFEGVELGISGNLYLRQGNTQKVVVKGQQNIIDLLEKDVKSGVWEIEFDGNVSDHKKVEIYVTIPNLHTLVLSGSGNIEGENRFTNLDDLQVYLSGSGDIKLACEAKNMKSKISGSGSIHLEGDAQSNNVSISGSGKVNAYDMQIASSEVRISGSGDCRLNVTDDLEVSIVGSGDVTYKGSPRVRSKIIGSGDVRNY